MAIASFSQRLLVILDWSISHPGKATAVIHVFLQNFSGWALILVLCIKLRKNCGLFRLHKVSVVTGSRIVHPKIGHVNPDLFLWVIFRKVPNLPNNGLFGNNPSSFRFPFVLLLWTQILRLSYCGIVAFWVQGLLVTGQVVASSPPELFQHNGGVLFQILQQPMMLGKQEGPQSLAHQTIR